MGDILAGALSRLIQKVSWCQRKRKRRQRSPHSIALRQECATDADIPLAPHFWRSAESLRDEARDLASDANRQMTPFGAPALCLYHACLDFFLNQQFAIWVRPGDDDPKRHERATLALAIQCDSGQRKIENALHALGVRDAFNFTILRDAVRLAHLHDLAHQPSPHLVPSDQHRSTIAGIVEELALAVEASSSPNVLSHLLVTEWARTVVIRFVDEYDRCRQRRRSTWDEWAVTKPGES